jgi:aromatic ring-opening dioxygenase LigB subunit
LKTAGHYQAISSAFASDIHSYTKHHLVHNINEALETKQYSSAAFLDIFHVVPLYFILYCVVDFVLIQANTANTANTANFFYFIYNLNQQSEFTKKKVLLILLQYLEIGHDHFHPRPSYLYSTLLKLWSPGL